ncbi:MAG: Pycsar system effector family protein [Ginsengibacter sp.]
MKELPVEFSYHEAAENFIKIYCEKNVAENIAFTYGFQNRMVREAMKIGKSLSIKKRSFENAITATWFAFAGVKIISGGPGESVVLLDKFFTESNYPAEDREVVRNAINTVRENKYADTKVEKIVCDAINSALAWPDIFENIILVKEEEERLTGVHREELYYLTFFRNAFLKRRYYTKYATEEYGGQREKNFELLERRIHKLESTEKSKTINSKNSEENQILSDKETEDLFKIAFRNYNRLISVADSKAALLIHVNSIIISVVLGLVISKIEKNSFLLTPTVTLFVFCLATIFLSVLASRPQKNSYSEKISSHTYQKFFFGSFDLIDSSFRHATWENYYAQLHELFNNAKDGVYLELFKESFNVRKVLARKFSYLSVAYWVFIIGLAVSILIFVISIKDHRIID